MELLVTSSSLGRSPHDPPHLDIRPPPAIRHLCPQGLRDALDAQLTSRGSTTAPFRLGTGIAYIPIDDLRLIDS